MGKMVEKMGRCLKTVFFMVAMLVSLLVSSLPVLVSILDVFVPTFLLSSFTCLSCSSFTHHLSRYSFKTSLTDIPLVSLIRSFLVICVYSLSDGPALSHGPYLGTVSLCSLLSILLLSVKACIFTANSQLNPVEASISPSRQRLHLKKSWGMPVLFLSSVVFALGHTVVAYRTSCRARRKLLFHSRVDPEAVLSGKGVFSSYQQKVPRSPIPLVRKVSKTDGGEVRRKLLPSSTSSHDGGELSVRVLADLDSLFVTVAGLSVHYKISTPGSPSPSLSSVSSSTLLPPPEANSMLNVPEAMAGRLKLDRKLLSMVTRNKLNHHHHKSCSSLFNNSSSSLHDPLLETSPTSPLLFKDTPEEACPEDDVVNASSCEQHDPSDGSSGQFGVVLVHGFGGGVFSWRNVMASLAHQLGCVVTAFDRPGWGLTARPHLKDLEDRDLPNPYTLENQVDMLVAFCHEMGFASVVLVGHDDGGLIALKAAQRLAAASDDASTIKVKGVVLLNVSLTREVVPAFARILLHTSLGKKHLVRPLLRTEIAQVVNRRAWYDPAKMTTDVLKLYKAPLHVEGWDEALHEIGRLSSEMVLSTQNAQSLLKAVESLPVLVVAGAEDALVPLKSSQVMASKLFNSRLVAISGCGHLPHEECPKALLAAMTPFISRLVLSD
ncbi:AB hydrolase-1 domain-containing protein [Hirschfeldia incana]|nr:AB hydrolase-1 domain-containing protein [Hirschfeldia incana]